MSSSIGKPSVCFDNSVVSIANALNEWSRKKKGSNTTLSLMQKLALLKVMVGDCLLFTQHLDLVGSWMRKLY
jgi:hypothetical protein